METKTDESFGVVPVIKNDNNDWEVFLINQINRFGGTFWGFPKGHRETGESDEVAARRELVEETNLKLNNLELSHPFIQHYDFIDEGILINKTVTYYLGYAVEKKFTVQVKEVTEAKWCSFVMANEILTHDNNRQLLEEVEEFLFNKQ